MLCKIGRRYDGSKWSIIILKYIHLAMQHIVNADLPINTMLFHRFAKRQQGIYLSNYFIVFIVVMNVIFLVESSFDTLETNVSKFGKQKGLAITNSSACLHKSSKQS